MTSAEGTPRCIPHRLLPEGPLPGRCRRRYAAEAARGEGARLYSGRWNSRGVAVVYASTSLALAAVETFVNLEPNLRPNDLVAIEGETPGGLEIATIDLNVLPAR